MIDHGPHEGGVVRCIASTVRVVGGLVLLSLACQPVRAQDRADPRYQTRASDCRQEPPPGSPLPVRRSDSGITARGYTAERILTLAADAARLRGGELVVCTEYGRVVIVDSDDDHVRLQIRMEGFGEGAPRPAEAATRVIEETTLHHFVTSHEGRLMVRVWHSRLGFTPQGGQPAFVSVRLQVPPRGSYTVRTEAFHGSVAVRRLTLAGATLRGNVGDKFKGIAGFVGETELDHVTLGGDVDIDNLVGLPGIRSPVPADMSSLAAPIRVKARVAASCWISAVTGGSINIAIQPAADLGVRALGESNDGRVNVTLDGGAAEEPAGTSSFRVRRALSTAAFDTKPVKVTIRAASGPGAVNIASIPAAPLTER
jgi:hypothetical protein